jgi:hypothetical protein
VKCVNKVLYNQFFVIINGASCPWSELSVGRVVMGQVVHGASCPWGELSLGRVVHGASCLWGELSMGRVVYGASLDGASCPWGEIRWGEWSGNPFLYCSIFSLNSEVVSLLHNASSSNLYFLSIFPLHRATI